MQFPPGRAVPPRSRQSSIMIGVGRCSASFNTASAVSRRAGCGLRGAISTSRYSCRSDNGSRSACICSARNAVSPRIMGDAPAAAVMSLLKLMIALEIASRRNQPKVKVNRRSPILPVPAPCEPVEMNSNGPLRPSEQWNVPRPLLSLKIINVLLLPVL